MLAALVEDAAVDLIAEDRDLGVVGGARDQAFDLLRRYDSPGSDWRHPTRPSATRTTSATAGSIASSSVPFARRARGSDPRRACRPRRKPHPPVVVTATSPHSKGITLAAERDWHPISCQYVQAHWIATHLPRYLEGLENAGAGAGVVGGVGVAAEGLTTQTCRPHPH